MDKEMEGRRLKPPSLSPGGRGWIKCWHFKGFFPPLSEESTAVRLSLALDGASVLLCWEAAVTGKEEDVLTRRPARRQRGRRTLVRVDQDPH